METPALNTQTPAPTPQPQSASSIGPIVGAVIIVILLAAGGIYFFLTEQERQRTAEEALREEVTGPQSGASDEVDAIEADLSATEETSVEGELKSLEQSL